MLPNEFTNRLRQLVPEARLDDVFSSFGTDRSTTFRVNTLKASRAEVFDALIRQDFELETVPWYENAFILRNRDLRMLTDTAEYKEGLIYVQSLSSMLPPLILDPKPGEKILDITAAPGSKTTQIAAIMDNDGEILANDSSRDRSYRLSGNIKIQGVAIVRTKKSDARAIWQQYPEYFDRVLADVPCSMEGRFKDNEPKSYEDWSLKKVKDLSRMQRWMLRSAVSSAKPGGLIVYSTCTMSPEENEEVIDWILEKERGNVMLEEVSIPHLTFDPPVRSWGGKKYDASIGLSGRILPSQIMEGFYIAKIRKIRSTVPKSAERA